MKVFELMNELSCFPGGEEVFLLLDGKLAIAGKAAIQLPAAGVDLQPPVADGGVKFASKAAGAAAAAAGLETADFEGHDPTSQGGFTVADVAIVAAAALAALGEEVNAEAAAIDAAGVAGE